HRPAPGSEGQRISDSGATLDGGAGGGLTLRRKAFAGQSCRGERFDSVTPLKFSRRLVRPGAPIEIVRGFGVDFGDELRRLISCGKHLVSTARQLLPGK